MRYFVLIPTLLLSACAAHKSDLDETFEWMDSTYNPHDNVNGASGHGRAAWYVQGEPASTRDRKMWGVASTFTHDGCTVTVKSVPDFDAEISRNSMTTSFSTFRLQDIDPASIELTAKTRYGGLDCEGSHNEKCDHATMHLTMKNDAGLIDEKLETIFPNLTGKEHQASATDKSNNLYWEFDDPKYAERFVKAFLHAIELCGGKPSKF